LACGPTKGRPAQDALAISFVLFVFFVVKKKERINHKDLEEHEEEDN